MDVVFVVLGTALIAAILVEVFNDLFHPGGTSALSDWIGRHLFAAFRRRPRWLPLAGPFAVVTVIATWIAGLVLGFALLYFPAYPVDFRTGNNMIPPEAARWSSVLYFSLETRVTLGYGDLVPRDVATRGISTVEALLGFGLLTASVSSIVLIYPALARMRLLARGVSHLVAAEKATGVDLAAAGSDVVLNTLAREVAHARIDLVHFPIVYDFTTPEPEASTAMWTAELARLSASARLPERPAHVRLAGAALDSALHDFAEILETRFLRTGSGDRARIFDAFAHAHLTTR